MSASIPQSIEALCKERGIDRELVIEAMKEAVRAAARKQFKSGEEIQVEWSAEDGLVIFATKEVVEEVTNPAKELSLEEARELAGDEVEVGDELQLPMPLEEMGRIAAQTAKQILTQKVRDAERANIYEQYIDKVGDLVNGYVKRFERGDIIVDLGNVEAILPRSQQSRSEQWAQGERIRVVIEDVHKDSKGPQVVVSRTSSELLRRLFEMEVPEIYDETVVIKSAVREPGERAKIAVASNERDVDPVGACVGMKGSRVQAIIRELRGEKIDIIEWSDEPSVFAANALSPAKVNQVRITDIERRQMEVIVNEDQLSLAIGKRGQNVRLATKLVGWNIDIRSEEDIKREVAQQMGALIASGGTVPLEALQGITPQTTSALSEHGIDDIDKLAATSVDDLVDILDISLDEAENILASARAVIDARDASKPSSEGADDAGETAEGDGHDGNEAAGALVESLSEAAPARRGDETGEDGMTGNGDGQSVEQHAASIEPDAEADAGEVRPSDASTNRGYDEAVEAGGPFRTEPGQRLAEESLDPVAMTEADPMSPDELLLQEAGRDLRADTITPSPDLTSSEAAVLESSGATMQGEGSSDDTAFAEDDSPISPRAALGGEASAPGAVAGSAYESENAESSAPGTNAVDVDEPDDASGNATE